MKTAVHLLAVASIVLAPSLSATQSNEASAVRVGITESEGELTPAVQSYIARGDQLTSELRFAAAAREYQRATNVARREGHLASGTSWKLATAYYNDDNLVAAAAALDRLSTDAQAVGDLEVEALSLYYAAWLGGKAGRQAETAARIARLEGLMHSRFLPVALRDQISAWLKTSKEVAVRR